MNSCNYIVTVFTTTFGPTSNITLLFLPIPITEFHIHIGLLLLIQDQ